jgi:hypothetical protein
MSRTQCNYLPIVNFCRYVRKPVDTWTERAFDRRISDRTSVELISHFGVGDGLRRLEYQIGRLIAAYLERDLFSGGSRMFVDRGLRKVMLLGN